MKILYLIIYIIILLLPVLIYCEEPVFPEQSQNELYKYSMEYRKLLLEANNDDVSQKRIELADCIQKYIIKYTESNKEFENSETYKNAQLLLSRVYIDIRKYNDALILCKHLLSHNGNNDKIYLQALMLNVNIYMNCPKIFTKDDKDQLLSMIKNKQEKLIDNSDWNNAENLTDLLHALYIDKDQMVIRTWDYFINSLITDINKKQLNKSPENIELIDSYKSSLSSSIKTKDNRVISYIYSYSHELPSLPIEKSKKIFEIIMAIKILNIDLTPNIWNEEENNNVDKSTYLTGKGYDFLISEINTSKEINMQFPHLSSDRMQLLLLIMDPTDKDILDLNDKYNEAVKKKNFIDAYDLSNKLSAIYAAKNKISQALSVWDNYLNVLITETKHWNDNTLDTTRKNRIKYYLKQVLLRREYLSICFMREYSSVDDKTPEDKMKMKENLKNALDGLKTKPDYPILLPWIPEKPKDNAKNDDIYYENSGDFVITELKRWKKIEEILPIYMPKDIKTIMKNVEIPVTEITPKINNKGRK